MRRHRSLAPKPWRKGRCHLGVYRRRRGRKSRTRRRRWLFRCHLSISLAALQQTTISGPADISRKTAGPQRPAQIQSAMATAQLYWQIWLFLLFLLWGMGAWHWKPTAVGGGGGGGGDGASVGKQSHTQMSLLVVPSAAETPTGGYLKAVWPDLFGCIVEVWPAPGARGAFKNVGGFAPHLLEGLPGPPGAGQTSKTHPTRPGQIAFRYPAR